MKVKRAIFVATALAMASVSSAAPSPAADSASIFEPGRISDGGVFGLTLSPDGNHALWVRSGGKREALAIMESFKSKGQWSAPVVVAFSGSADWKDIDPAFSPDGKTVIYQSTRPVQGKPERKGFDIWSVSRSDGKWGSPVHLGNKINTDESESSASIAGNGSIYFMRNNGQNTSDLWVSRLVNGEYHVAENLGAPINTSARESNPYIAPDESYLIYFSSAMPIAGDVDLLISFRENGKWGAPRRLDAPINSPLAEFCPWVHEGRLYLSRQVKQGDRFIEDIHSFPFDPNVYRTRPVFTPSP